MKTFKTQLNSYAAIAALSSMLVASNAIGGIIPLDGNGNGHWETNSLDLVYTYSGLYYGINNNGINNGAYPDLGYNGFIHENKTSGFVDIGWAAKDTNGGSHLSVARLEARSSFVKTGGLKELQFGLLSNYIGGFGYEPNMLLGDTYSTCTTGFSIGEGLSPSAPPANGLQVAGAISTDGGMIISDGSGNLIVHTVTQLSDRTQKENIQAIPQGRSLEMARALNDFSWNFKSQAASPQTSQKAVTTQSTQFGPMAQDWHAVTGLDDGRHISLTAMQGLLLGAVKDLADQLPSQGSVAHSTDSTAGQGAGIVKWDANYIYISVGTNQWRRAALETW